MAFSEQTMRNIVPTAIKSNPLNDHHCKCERLDIHKIKKYHLSFQFFTTQKYFPVKSFSHCDFKSLPSLGWGEEVK